jgi:hypothetical protein
MAVSSSSLGVSRVLIPVVKRKAYFSFHYADIMRVNNARMTGALKKTAAASMRTFYDASLWESRKLEGPEALKRLVREGVQQTSVVCVLIGTETWSRRWVKYEIARAVIDNRGLLGVDINNIKHHQRFTLCPLGLNPFSFLAVGKVQSAYVYAPPAYYLFELTHRGWQRYLDHTAPVKLPPYLPECAEGLVTPLSHGVPVYDFAVHDGPNCLGAWIDHAAQKVGR